MRLYAIFVLAVAVLHARAATVPIENEKKIVEPLPDNSDKITENVSSEEELLDQANTIKDVENNLRAKPEDIPVEVIVEDAQPALKADNENKDSEEINRPVPDLRNPGPPQRQEHETQNPEYYAPEQQIVMNLKQSISDAQNMLRQGLQGICERIQNMLVNNEPINTIQQSIQSLRDGFTEQIQNINGTIQHYLNAESANVNEPAGEQTKASFFHIEHGLNALRNDFNRGVKSLADGVDIVASLKAENENPSGSDPASTAAPAASSSTPAAAPINPFNLFIQNFQQAVGDSFRNITTSINNFAQNLPNPFNPQSTTAAPALPAGVQSDSQVPASTAAPGFWQGVFGSGLPQLPQAQPGQNIFTNPFTQASNQFITNILNFFQPNRTGSQTPQGAQAPQPAPTAQPAPPAQPAQAASNPETPAESAQPAAQAQAVTPIGPIRQILQNNPISQGIAGAVQRLQNINNPEKPRETEKNEEQKSEDVKKDEEKTETNESLKGHGHYGSNNNAATGDNNDVNSSSSGIEQAPVPEVQKQSEDKPNEVVDKTE